MDKGLKIGFMGLFPASGTTHMAIAMANFAAGNLGYKTALVEYSGHGEIEDIRENEKGIPFEIYGVDYYPDLSAGKLIEVYNEEYDCYVLDFGCLDDDRIEEFSRCDRKYLLGMSAPWKYHKLINKTEKLKNNKNILKGASILIGGSSEDKKNISRISGLQVRSMPFIADVFRLERGQRAFFNELF